MPESLDDAHFNSVISRALSQQGTGIVGTWNDADLRLLAYYGAAYRVVLERLNPDGCGPDEWPHVVGRAEVLRTWAALQEQPVRAAYERAITDVVKRAAARIENANRGLRMAALYEQIPKPPL